CPFYKCYFVMATSFTYYVEMGLYLNAISLNHDKLYKFIRSKDLNDVIIKNLI
ncbi:hypothetical protein QBC46DRAFT_217468, partial [Diplogelasinospora grovesii]